MQLSVRRCIIIIQSGLRSQVSLYPLVATEVRPLASD